MIDDRHAAILRAHDLRGLEDRIDQMAAERSSLHPFRQLREIGPEGRLPGAGDMALEAGQMGGVKDEGAAAGVATGGHVREEPIPRLGKERFGQALGLRTSREEVHRAGEADHHRRNVQNS